MLRVCAAVLREGFFLVLNVSRQNNRTTLSRSHPTPSTCAFPWASACVQLCRTSTMCPLAYRYVRTDSNPQKNLQEC